MPGETPGRSRSYQLWGCRECSVDYYEKAVTKATAPLFRDQIEKAIHPFYGTRRILWRWGRLHRRHTAFLGCGGLRQRDVGWHLVHCGGVDGGVFASTALSAEISRRHYQSVS